MYIRLLVRIRYVFVAALKMWIMVIIHGRKLAWRELSYLFKSSPAGGAERSRSSHLPYKKNFYASVKV